MGMHFKEKAMKTRQYETPDQGIIFASRWKSPARHQLWSNEEENHFRGRKPVTRNAVADDRRQSGKPITASPCNKVDGEERRVCNITDGSLAASWGAQFVLMRRSGRFV